MKKTMLLMGLAILTLCGCSNENGKVEKSASDVVIETIMTRRSIRQYKDEPVSREQMETILKCGINAPSGSNRQEWEIRVVDNPEFINGCTEAWKKTLDADRLTKMVDANFKNMFRNAPTVVFIACPKGTELNCGFLGQNMMLSAWSMGIGTCCLGGPVQFFRTEAGAEYLKKLEFSEGYEILYAIAFGYPDETPDAKPRDWGKVKFLD
ncbi:MAG: nitroreductase [Bacteroidales bacterium]|nr:nitroreductase [Bacteroidales bacterium]